MCIVSIISCDCCTTIKGKKKQWSESKYTLREYMIYERTAFGRTAHAHWGFCLGPTCCDVIFIFTITRAGNRAPGSSRLASFSRVWFFAKFGAGARPCLSDSFFSSTWLIFLLPPFTFFPFYQQRSFSFLFLSCNIIFQFWCVCVQQQVFSDILLLLIFVVAGFSLLLLGVRIDLNYKSGC